MVIIMHSRPYLIIFFLNNISFSFSCDCFLAQADWRDEEWEIFHFLMFGGKF